MKFDPDWEVPKYELTEFKPRIHKYCVCIPVINEGEKIQKELKRLSKLGDLIDIIILDGGSTDGSLQDEFLISNGVRAVLTKQDTGKLSAQLRMGFSYALSQGYEGIITVDGNNKDSVESIPLFIGELDNKVDFVQGSRYVPGGKEINTPFSRKLAIKLIHAPFISLLSGFKYTDTTNGFRAHSKKFLLDNKLKPFRHLFSTYELLAYVSVKAPRLGYKVKEIPVTREYPIGKIPTKISPLRGNLLLLRILVGLLIGKYNPRSD
ncbi:glycosyltransferase family 2 protein [Paenibacillus whitsoniae]|uniref:Glycosyltransferase family 2 protein n=1 Tax=Paenibacillus whitsoniae TaxID=2496558 RepID=A0A3S0C9W4_9BACL|nr:glycosyltransferase family 2 protein [Paenibacillus whitsoniae]RTE08155.1 glycosyltransferase family 2 protein [Paenibacillus whitsoniae]